MQHRRVMALSSFLIALSMLTSVAFAASAVRGILKSVDGKKETLTLVIKENKEEVEKTFELAPDAKINIDGGFVRLVDLKPGMELQCTLADDGKAYKITEIKPTRKKKKE